MESRSPEDRARETRGSGVREFLTLLFKHKGKIVSVFLAFVLTATLLSFWLPPSYEARSRLLIKFGREYIAIPEVGGTPPFLALKQEEVINSEIQILTSRELIENVVRTMEVETLYPALAGNPPAKMSSLDAAILTFKNALAVEGVKKSNVIEVSFRHGDPRTAADAVNILVYLFKEKHLKVFSNPQFSFLERQFAIYEDRLREAGDRLERFKNTYGVHAFDEQRTLLIRQRIDLDGALKGARNRIDELRERLASLDARKRSDALSDAVPIHTDTERDNIIVQAKDKLLALRLKEAELLKAYNDGSRVVANVRHEIRLVEEFLKDQEEDIRKRVKTGNVVYREVETDLIRTEADLKEQIARAAALERQISQLDENIGFLSLREKEYLSLNREMALSEKNYRTYAERMEDARISDQMDEDRLANISVIHEAAPPPEPVSPKKKLNIALGILLGGLSGLTLAFFSEYTSQFLSTPGDVERRLGLPVLAAVSYKKK
jgi:polysaccharide biosynthesis protein PslE